MRLYQRLIVAYLISSYQIGPTWMSDFKFMLHQMLCWVWVIWRSINNILENLVEINGRCIVVCRVTHFSRYDNPPYLGLLLNVTSLFQS